mmetsp:Transcript_18508/g.44229  ORF Transcript_18508/g.44229 Transcript_18508/m.44229 type:complete len:436 (+) Transcript_18508:223-1530(+)
MQHARPLHSAQCREAPSGLRWVFLVQVDGLVCDAGVDLEHIIHSSFKVGGGIVALRNEAVVRIGVIGWHGEVADKYELFLHLPEEGQAWRKLCFGVACLDSGAHKGHPLALGSNVVAVGAAEDVDVMLAVQLLLRQNDLSRVRVVRVRDRVVEDAHRSDDLADLLELAREVARVTDDKFAPGDLAAALHTDRFTRIIENHLCIGLVEHVRSSMDSAEPSKCLGELAKPVQGVDVGGLDALEAEEGLVVQLDLHHRGQCGLRQVAVLAVEGDRVPDEVDRLGLKAVFGVELCHGHGAQIHARMGLWVLRAVILEVQEEIARPALLKHPHERRAECLVVVRRHLVDLSLHINVAAIHCLELEVLSDVCVHKHTHKFTISHDELGNNVHVVVSARAKRLRRFLSWAELLPELLKTQGSRLSTVIVVSVHVEDLQAFHG